MFLCALVCEDRSTFILSRATFSILEARSKRQEARDMHRDTTPYAHAYIIVLMPIS